MHLLAEDGSDGDFDGNHSDDFSSIHYVGLYDLTLEDGLVLDGDFTCRLEVDLDLCRAVHRVQRALLWRDGEHVTYILWTLLCRLKHKPEEINTTFIKRILLIRMTRKIPVC